MSTFKDSLGIEKSLQPEADNFYKKNLAAVTIIRYDWNDPVGREYQNNDIDCSIECYAPGIDSFWLNISEKFRQHDWGDMCIELWNDFDKKKLGWGLTGKNVDMYLYRTPENIYEIWRNNGRFDFMMEYLSEQLNWDRIKNEFEGWNKNRKTVNIALPNGDACNVTLVRGQTENKYFSICVSIPWKILRDDFLLEIQKYKNDYKEYRRVAIY